MKILSLIGSPRRIGNTDLMVLQLLKVAEHRGYTPEKVFHCALEVDVKVLATPVCCSPTGKMKRCARVYSGDRT